jgi:lipopolysaccharide transport system ATP-binding protein
MRLRLGFAVAAHLDPDVLIVDEVLAVGDAAFQRKCIKAMEGMQKTGRTVLFVSHNLAAVENLCSRGIWLDAGKVRMDGGTREVILAYMSSFAGADAAGSDLSQLDNRLGSGDIRFTRLEYLAPDGTSCGVARSGDALVIRMHYRAVRPMIYPSFGFRLYSELGTLITETGHYLHGLRIPLVDAGDGFLDLEIDMLNLVPGSYHLSLWATAAGGQPVYDGDVRAELTVEVANVYPGGRELHKGLGIVYFPQRWRIPQLESVG